MFGCDERGTGCQGRVGRAAVARNDIMPLVSSDADLSANAVSNSLVITDTSAKINRLTQIIQKLDNVQTVPLKLEYKQLQFTNAQDASRLANAMFSNSNGSGQQSAGDRHFDAHRQYCAPDRTVPMNRTLTRCRRWPRRLAR